MKSRVTPLLFYRVMTCLVVGGARHGISFGTCIGTAAALLFLLEVIVLFASVGFLAISACAIGAIPFGFVAGVIATACGGRRGWMVAGAISLAAPVVWIGILMLQDLAHHPRLHASAGDVVNTWYCFAAAVGVVAAFGGAVGRWHGRYVPDPLFDTRTGAVLTWEAARTAKSGQTPDVIAPADLPAGARVVAAAIDLILIVGVVWDAGRILVALYMSR